MLKLLAITLSAILLVFAESTFGVESESWRTLQVTLLAILGFWFFDESLRVETRTKSMPTVEGKKVLVTGAAQGMGKLMATKAVQENASTVILWDINAKGLESTAEELRASGGKIHVQVVDVSKLENIQEAARATKQAVGAPDILFNNAGVVRGKMFWEHDSVRDIAFTMNINTMAPMYIAREFIVDMIESGKESRIVNIASAAGLVSNPKMSVYCGSKAACAKWSDSVRLELEAAGKDHVKVTTVCPGYISTGMFDGVKAPLLTPILTPEVVVQRVWDAMKVGQPVLKLPWTIHLASFLHGVLSPRMFDLIAGKVFGVYSTMDEFKGHKADAAKAQAN